MDGVQYNIMSSIMNRSLSQTFRELSVYVVLRCIVSALTESSYCVFGHYSLFCFFLLFKTQSVGDWILCPSSGKSLLSWAQSTELVPISKHQHKIGYINVSETSDRE
jgi:hypothetical protein